MNSKIALVLILTTVSASLWADEIRLNSGRVLRGAIVSQTSNEYAIKTDYGTLRAARGEVREVVQEDTTPEEVDGDTAFASRNYGAALQYYRVALGRVAKTSQAVARLNQKLARIQGYRQEQSNSQVAVQMRQAQQLMASKRYAEAVKLLESQLPGLAPGDEVSSSVRRLLAEAHYASAQLARDSVNEIETRKQLKDAIDAYEPFYKAHLQYGELLIHSSVSEQQGIDEILRGLRYGEGQLSEEELIKYHYIVGSKYFDRKNYEGAARYFAETLRVKGNFPQYQDALDRAVDSYLKLGEQNIMKDLQKTINNLNEALRLNPENKDAHFLLGRMYKDTGQSLKAIDELKKVTQIDPNYPSVFHLLAQAYLDQHNYDEALKALTQELEKKPDNYDAIVDRAETNIKLVNYDAAIADLDKAKQIEPNRWRAYLLTAQLSFVREEYSSAQENLGRVLSIKPDAIEAHILMGKVLVAQKSFDDARKWFQNVVQYLEKVPNLSFKYRTFMADAQTELGEIDFFQDSPRQAETRFRQALDFLPNYWRAFSKIGNVKRRLGDETTDKTEKQNIFKQAEGYYLKSIEMNPRDPDAYLSLGILYHKNLKDTAKAVVNYQAYLKYGGRDRANVNKWIEECGGKPVEESGETSGTVSALTSSTLALGSASTSDTAKETSASAGETSSTAKDTTATASQSASTSATVVATAADTKATTAAH